MANRAIINKHIDSLKDVNLLDLFVKDQEKAKGEIIIVNEPTAPSIYILGSDGIPQAVVGGSNGGSGEGVDPQVIQVIQGTLADHENRLDVIEPVVTGHTQDIQSIKEQLAFSHPLAWLRYQRVSLNLQRTAVKSSWLHPRIFLMRM